MANYSTPKTFQQGNKPTYPDVPVSVPPPFQPSAPFSGWVLLPLRLFLGITFIYAGVQKLTDPQFFHKSTPGYIGNQVIAFAHNTPLHDLLIRVVLPHAVLFGWAIALGEIAIGLGTLCGLLFRPAAFAGLLLSVLFFLSASWHVYPYFYGADIVFVFSWLTMLLNGPVNTGLPTVDGWFVNSVLADNFTQQQRLVSLLAVLLAGTPGTATFTHVPHIAPSSGKRQRAAQRALETRRSFVTGAFAGGIGVFAVGLIGYALSFFGHSNDNTTSSTSATTPSTANPTQPQSGSTPGTTGIAQVSAVPKNSAATFTIPSTGDPGVLIHLSNDTFVAYDATCTHAGCQVDYDPTSQHLICPCHGAEYDPSQSAAVVSGPTNTPLTSVSIRVDSATGAITLQ